MQSRTQEIIRNRTWGFRFSFVDSIVLIATAVSTPWLVHEIGTFGWLPAFVVLHFFLFCNVFRIRRVPELVWGLCFVLLSISLIAVNYFRPDFLMLIQLPVTVILITRDVRHRSYHGVLARRLNPRLDEYLNASVAQPSRLSVQLQ